VLVYLQYISAKIHSKCASQPKIPKNHLKPIFLGFKVAQGHRCWYPRRARQQCLLWYAASLCLSATIVVLFVFLLVVFASIDFMPPLHKTFNRLPKPTIHIGRVYLDPVVNFAGFNVANAISARCCLPVGYTLLPIPVYMLMLSTCTCSH